MYFNTASAYGLKKGGGLGILEGLIVWRELTCSK